MIPQKIWRYWNTVQQLSDAEVIGNILISSILFTGNLTRNILDELLEHLKGGPTI